ncbi:MAG: hypothetical protein M1835_001303 [Candelina submexicana]|nr:MAG: hypothetical protein M1835_001303 [Candelina submexicana]
MEGNSGGTPERKSSNTSNKSIKSRPAGTVRVKPRKHASSSSLTATSTPSDKSLTSFPSLSPDVSPAEARNGTPKKAPAQSPSQTPRKSSDHTPSMVESLTTNTPSKRDRSALFADTPLRAQDVPGALHHASDGHIERLVAKNGVVALVRQLSGDLAQRDAQLSALRRRTDERERLLRKMLLECEVSNLDIETRLHSINHPPASKVADTSHEDTPRRGKPKRPKPDRPVNTSSDIHDMIGQAMSDEVGDGMDDASGDLGFPAVAGNSGYSGLRRGDRRSVDSGTGPEGWSKATTRGWNFFWGGNKSSQQSSKASSVISAFAEDVETTRRPVATRRANSRRQGLSDDLFQPPESSEFRGPSRTLSLQAEVRDEYDSDSQSRKSSSSIASWAVKLVAGNSQAARDSNQQKTIRSRAATTGDGVVEGSRTASTVSTNIPGSAQVALSKASGKAPLPNRPRKSSVTRGPSGTIKGTSQEGWRSAISNILPQGSTQETHLSSNGLNPGPVEMDRILPSDTRPPTLTQTNEYNPHGFLTDRFGFICDHRRKERLQEASARRDKRSSGAEMLNGIRKEWDADDETVTNALNGVDQHSSRSTTRLPTPTSFEGSDPRPTKTWQDYLKIATFPTELLSHTPSAATAMDTVDTNKADTNSRQSQITIDKKGSLPSISQITEPLASPVVSENAELARPSMSGNSTPVTPIRPQPEPVRLLLEQLTELHDNLQREKTVRWNEFLRKVRAERKKEGDSVAAAEGRLKEQLMPEVALADGEIIGVAGLGNKGKVGRAKWKEFKSLVLAGIPVAFRAKIWAECSGATALRIPGYYDDLVNSDDGDPIIVAQIQMDISRTLTDNIFFRHGPGVAKLNEVLLAYARRNPEVGYCQGMNLITACLLLIMPTAEDAFWVLAILIESILPKDYYDHSLLASRADQQVLRQYVAEILPKLSQHLDSMSIELEALTFQWFLSIFTDCLSAEALFRVWDVILCINDGSTFLFQVALALLTLNEKMLLDCQTPSDIYGYINHQMTNHAISIDGLVHASEGLKQMVKRHEVEERRARAIEDEKEITRQRQLARAGTVKNAHREEVEPQKKVIDAHTSIDEARDGGDGHLIVQTPMPVDEESGYEWKNGGSST